MLNSYLLTLQIIIVLACSYRGLVYLSAWNKAYVHVRPPSGHLSPTHAHLQKLIFSSTFVLIVEEKITVLRIRIQAKRTRLGYCKGDFYVYNSAFLCKLLSGLLKNSSAPVLGSSCNSTVIKFQFFKFHFNSITLASKALRKVKSKIQKKMFQLNRAWFRAAQA